MALKKIDKFVHSSNNFNYGVFLKEYLQTVVVALRLAIMGLYRVFHHQLCQQSYTGLYIYCVATAILPLLVSVELKSLCRSVCMHSPFGWRCLMESCPVCTEVSHIFLAWAEHFWYGLMTLLMPIGDLLLIRLQLRSSIFMPADYKAETMLYHHAIRHSKT